MGLISLRNLPPHALHLAHRLSEQTHLSMADLLRQAVVSGLLVEATRVAPGPDGTLGGLDPATLAKTLRRSLSSAIDLLVEYGEHPYQAMMAPGERLPPNHAQAHPQEPAQPKPVEEDGTFFENALGDDLEALGIGMSLAEIGGNREASQPTPE